MLTRNEIKTFLLWFSDAEAYYRSNGFNTSVYRLKSRRYRIPRSHTIESILKTFIAEGYMETTKEFAFFTNEGVEAVKIFRSTRQL